MTYLPPRRAPASGIWSASEHERFLEAVSLYPHGPWHVITAHVGTRSTKQVQTHAQKYQHKLRRHQRGLRKKKTTSKRPEHRVDKMTAGYLINGSIIPAGQRSNLSAHAMNPALDQKKDLIASPPRSPFATDLFMAHFGHDAVLGELEPLPFDEWNRGGRGTEQKHRIDNARDDCLFLETIELLLVSGPPVREEMYRANV